MNHFAALPSSNTASDPDTPLFATYIGPSMNPALCEPEVMEVVPYGSRPALPGDVILFAPPGSDQPVVHRIRQVTGQGICTRGDNNRQDDSYLLEPTDIAGRVVAAWRGERRRTIAGGLAGRWLSRWLRWRQAADQSISRLLHPLYRALARRGVLRGLLPSRLQPRVVAFRKGKRRQLLLLGRQVVGWYDADWQRWHIRRPYRLFVDERALLTTVSKGSGENLEEHEAT